MTARKCPVCGKPTVAKFQPFCSKRCHEIDLGRWLDGRYRIPTEETPGPSDGPGDGGEGEED
jgi:hypothetical protein